LQFLLVVEKILSLSYFGKFAGPMNRMRPSIDTTNLRGGGRKPMRALLIDSSQYQIRGVEVDPLKLKQAFIGDKTVVPIELSSIAIDSITVLFYDRNAVLKYPAAFFYIEGLSGPIFGKGLLLGHRQGIGPESTHLKASEVESIVGFHKAKGSVR
jgi:hypothetical protein